MYRGKFAFQNRWASLIFGKKFTVFPCLALYYITGQFPSTSLRAGPGDGGLIFEGAI